MRRITPWFCLALIAACLPASARPRAGEIVLEHGSARDESGAAFAYEIGTLYVPEHRGKPGSRIIGVGFARIKSQRPAGTPPIFWLPGGPGLSVLGAFADNDAGKLRLWRSLSEVGDLVVIEQRGYSMRGEMLTVRRTALPLDRPASVEEAEVEMKARARRHRRASGQGLGGVRHRAVRRRRGRPAKGVGV